MLLSFDNKIYVSLLTIFKAEVFVNLRIMYAFWG